MRLTASGSRFRFPIELSTGRPAMRPNSPVRPPVALRPAPRHMALHSVHPACDSAYMINRTRQSGPQRKSFSICSFGSSITGDHDLAHCVVLHVLYACLACPLRLTPNCRWQRNGGCLAPPNRRWQRNGGCLAPTTGSGMVGEWWVSGSRCLAPLAAEWWVSGSLWQRNGGCLAPFL